MAKEGDLSITGAELTAVARAINAFRRHVLRRPDPVAILKRRAEVKEEIRTRLYAEDANWGKPPEILVVKLGKHDDYPNTDERVFGRGASNWFKGEVKGLHDRGVEIYSSIEHVIVRNGKARRVDFDDPDPARQKVWIVGRIPYERIAYIDWEPDPGYSAPRFYVAYTTLKHEAYRDVVIYEGGFDGRHAYEMCGVKYVGEGGSPRKRIGRWVRRTKYRLEFRREARRVRSGKNY